MAVTKLLPMSVRTKAIGHMIRIFTGASAWTG